MEIDTRASASTINYDTYLKLCTRTKEKVIMMIIVIRIKKFRAIQQLLNNIRLIPPSTADHFCVMNFFLLSFCVTIK